MSREIIRRFHFVAAADNHTPAREYASGDGTVYAPMVDGDGNTIVPETVELYAPNIPNPESALYLIDDGATIVPMYVAGWRQDGPTVFLQAFPVNGAIRPDNGRPADFYSWQLGPRKAWHLKVIPAREQSVSCGDAHKL